MEKHLLQYRALFYRHASDRNRQVQLARRRAQLRRRKILQGEEIWKPKMDDSFLPEKGIYNLWGLQISV